MVATGSCVMRPTGQIGQRICLNSWPFGQVRDAIGSHVPSGPAVMLKWDIIRLLKLSLHCRDFGFEAKKCSVCPVAEELKVLKEFVAGLKDVKLVGQVRRQRRCRWGHSGCINFQHLCAWGQAKKCIRIKRIVGSWRTETQTSSKNLQRQSKWNVVTVLVSLPGDEAGCWELSFPWLSQAACAVRDGGASLRRCSATQSGAHTASGPSAAVSVWASAEKKNPTKSIRSMLGAFGLACQGAHV